MLLAERTELRELVEDCLAVGVLRGVGLASLSAPVEEEAVGLQLDDPRIVFSHIPDSLSADDLRDAHALAQRKPARERLTNLRQPRFVFESSEPLSDDVPVQSEVDAAEADQFWILNADDRLDDWRFAKLNNGTHGNPFPLYVSIRERFTTVTPRRGREDSILWERR